MLSLVLATALSASISKDASTWNYEALRERIGHAATLEEALGKLPDEYWSNYTLMRESGSLQPASDPLPRVIAYGNDARLILAWAGDAKATHGNELEVIQFRDETGRFEFRRVSFLGAGHDPDFSPANPRECRSCHQAEPRPNWGNYPRWPGNYGDYDDGIASEHKDAYLKFVASAPKLERYRRLQRPSGPAISPYSPQGMAALGFRPNLVLSQLLLRLNAKRFAHRILHGEEKDQRLVATLAFFDCEELPPLVRARVEALVGSGGWTRNRLWVKLGVAPTDYDLEFVPPQPVALYPFGDYFDGVLHQDDAVARELVRELAKEHAPLRPFDKQTSYNGYDSQPSPRDRRLAGFVNGLGGGLDAEPRDVCRVLTDLVK